MYSYCYVCSVLCILFHCVVLSIVCVQMCTVLLPLGGNQIAVNKIYQYSYNPASMSSGAEEIQGQIQSHVTPLVYDQLEAQFLFAKISLFQSSTCFEQTRAHHQEVNCVNTASVIVTLETSEWSKITRLQYAILFIKH